MKAKNSKIKSIQQLSSCQNCGCPDEKELEYFHHVLDGITLCDTCSWMSITKLPKELPEWKKIDGSWIVAYCNPGSCKQSEAEA